MVMVSRSPTLTPSRSRSRVHVAQLKAMYEKLNERIITALLDHKWIELAMEQLQWCGMCTCMPFCY